MLTGAYRNHLVGALTLQELPQRPDFVFNTTNVQTGADFRFTRRYMRDYRVGCLPYPTVELARDGCVLVVRAVCVAKRVEPCRTAPAGRGARVRRSTLPETAREPAGNTGESGKR